MRFDPSRRLGLGPRREGRLDHVAAADLVTVGYGKSKPKDPANPTDPANRRVQVVTMSSKTASK